MKLTDLFEALNWAIGSNKNRAQAPKRQDGNLIVWLDAKEVLPLIDPAFRVTPDSSANHIGDRMKRAEEHFKAGNWMDPPDVCFVDHNPRYPIGIGNGRHRIAASLKLGKSWFPANVDPEDLEKLKKVIKVRNHA